jgi:hypothetical protein
LGHEETFMQLIAEKERKEGSSRPIEIENIYDNVIKVKFNKDS